MGDYDHLILLPRDICFHFRVPPPADIASSKYLDSSDPAEVIAAVLASARLGDFSHFTRIINLMKANDGASVWDDCSMLFSYAAPFSALRELLDAFDNEIVERKDAVTGQWISEILCSSGALWCVPEVLRILRFNEERTKYFSAPQYLSFLLEEERGEISFGPPVLRKPDWFDFLPDTFDDDEYDRIVMSRHAELCNLVADPSVAAFYEGEPLLLENIARKALHRVTTGSDIEEVSIARSILEANTGVDLSGFYRNANLSPLSAAALIESLLEDGELTRFEPGHRYFFGHRIPA